MSLNASGAYLAPREADDDSSILSDRENDSEDDQILGRASQDIRAHDRGLLLEEEEREKVVENTRRENRQEKRRNPLRALLSSNNPEYHDEEYRTDEKGAKKRRSKRGRGKKRPVDQDDETGGLMYEMEEGLKTSSSSASLSSEADFLTLRNAQRPKTWRINWCLLHLGIAAGFTILAVVAWKLSSGRRSTKTVQQTLSNGTAIFAPTTILISLDGFRADFLTRGITPRLNAFIQEGISPVYMTPSFPSVTFPNHYTLVTGLYPESHGIVGNTFWDLDLQEEFYYTDPTAMQPKWWGGEPLWATAEEQGIRTAVHMWPGSEAHILGVEPAYVDKFNAKEPLSNKVARILELLDKPGLESSETTDIRPQLIAAYVPDVDADGHRYGPNSTEIRATIQSVDTMLDSLFQGLEERNLTSIVNVVVVSDHGMATTDISRMIQLEDIIDISLIEHTDGWPLYGLRPKNLSDLQGLYDTLIEELNPAFDVYLRDVNMPERYHFSANERIAPLWIVPNTGWAIVTKDEFDIAASLEAGEVYHPRGLHGYDHEHPLMRAIFVARGPAFPHRPNSRVEPFQNIEIYNIVCDSLGLEPRPNNGTLRLPLKPVGTHSQDTQPEDPSDPVDITPVKPTESDEDEEPNMVISISPVEASSVADFNLKPPHLVGVDPLETGEEKKEGEEENHKIPVIGDEHGDEFNDIGGDPTKPQTNVEEGNPNDVEGGGQKTSTDADFWKWFEDELSDIKVWVGNQMGHAKQSETDEESSSK